MPANPNTQPLRPIEFEILLTLADGERHGYAIIQEVEARSDGEMRLETGTLYRALRRLVADGYAKPAARRSPSDASDAHDDERRRYYAITPAGRQVAAAEAARLARLVAAARSAKLLTRPAKG
ncbi:MAG TPA: PadR family transcriptional regulator [Gemmatimonadaceae bacterium]|nr:PadR family transcriptional regulator [Gemmatimonadaceae bacterium]